MEMHKKDHLQLSLLGFTTLTLKLITSGNIGLLKKTFLFITRLFIQSTPEVKSIIIENYLYAVYNFLNDCDQRKKIIGLFPFWMRNEYLRMMQGNQKQDKEIVFMLHLN